MTEQKYFLWILIPNILRHHLCSLLQFVFTNHKLILISFLGDLTEMQTALAKFVAACRVYLKHSLDPRWMLQLLTDLEHASGHMTLTKEEEIWLAEHFTSILGNIHYF